MNIQSILALTDLSASGDRALERAALLATQHRALLKVMYVAAEGGAPRANAFERASCTAMLLAKRWGIAVKMADQTGNTLETVLEEARYSDLVVVGYKRKRALFAATGGRLLQQLMRSSPCPLLVTKAANCRPYGRIVVAVDFTPESANLAQMAFALDAAAEVELFHALRMSYGARLGYPQAHANALENFKAACIKQAGSRCVCLTDSFEARRNRVMSTQRLGDPARQAVNQQHYTKAGLLVVGRRRTSWWMDFLTGSVAQRATTWSTGDVLIVPHDFQTQLRGSAVPRVGVAINRKKAAMFPLESGVS